MPRANTALVSYAPALSDAFALEDLPAHLSFTAEDGGALRLTDADQHPVGDPVREFVADVLQSVDDSAAPLRLLTAEARIRPRLGSGRGIDLADLHRTFVEMRMLGVYFAPLVEREMRVDIQISGWTTPDGIAHVQAWPTCALCRADVPSSIELAGALTDYISGLAELTAEAIGGPLGAWIVDSGLTHLLFGAQFTIPTTVEADRVHGQMPSFPLNNSGLICQVPVQRWLPPK